MNDRLQIINGDALTSLKALPESCVQTCVTSPPFWRLRDYGTATWEGGDPDCPHRLNDTPTVAWLIASTFRWGSNTELQWLANRYNNKTRSIEIKRKRIGDRRRIQKTPKKS